MDPVHQKKLYKIYNYQVNFFRAAGVHTATKQTSTLKKIAYTFHFAVVLIWLGSYDLALLIGFFQLPTIMEKITKVFFVLATLLGCVAKLCFLRKDILILQDQINFLYKDIFIPTNFVETAIFQRNYVLGKRVRNWYCWVSLSALACVLWMHHITNADELPLAMYTPFELHRSRRTFLSAEIYSCISVTGMCCLNIAFDSWCTSFIIFAKGQLEILENRLQCIGSDVGNDIAVGTELRQCIRHYSEIFRFVETIERGISVSNSIQILCSVLVLCCNFYAMSFISFPSEISNFVKFFIYQMAMLSQIFLLCYFANDMTLASLRLSHALYSSNWIPWSKENRKLMMLAMVRFQIPIHVRSINSCYPFNLAAFTSIVNSSYTYFALLKQMNNRA